MSPVAISSSTHSLVSEVSEAHRSRRDAVLLAVERGYDFPEFGGNLGNVGWEGAERILANSWTCPIPRDHV